MRVSLKTLTLVAVRVRSDVPRKVNVESVTAHLFYASNECTAGDGAPRLLNTPLAWGNPEIPPTVEEESSGPCGGRLAVTTVDEDDPLFDEERRAASLGDTRDRRPGDISPSCHASVSTGEATHLLDGVDGSCSVLVEDVVSVSTGVALSWHSRPKSSSWDAPNGSSFEMYLLNPARVR